MCLCGVQLTNVARFVDVTRHNAQFTLSRLWGGGGGGGGEGGREGERERGRERGREGGMHFRLALH